LNHLFQTLNFFKRFNINYNFIETSPSTWENNLEYKRGKEIISKLKIVNDTAERAVKLIEDFNKLVQKMKNRSSIFFKLSRNTCNSIQIQTKALLWKNYNICMQNKILVDIY
jgi:hypothetical protein